MTRLVQRLPNWLTYLRLGLIPIFVLLLVDPTDAMVRAAIVIFVIAAFTDYFDGIIARRFGAISDFGKLLDPLADKILVTAALVMLTSLRSDTYGEPWVPGWMVVLALSREIWVTGLRGVAASRGTVVPASNSGKVKSGLQMVAIVFLLLHDTPVNAMGMRLTCQIVGLNLFLVSLVVSYWGAAEYTHEILWSVSSSSSGESRSEPGEATSANPQ